MRQSEYGPRISFTVALIIANVLFFVVQQVAAHLGQSYASILANYCELSLPGLYVASGVIGGLVQLLYFFLTSENGSVVGASAGGTGLVGAFCMLSWDESFSLLVFYIIPVTMRGKTLFWLSLGLASLFLLTPQSHIANAAHLGGLLAGFLYVRQIFQGRWHLPQWHLPARRSPPREFAARRVGKKAVWGSGPIPPDEDLSPSEYLQKEVDPILDKISASGIQSLTQREREILEKARSRMNKR
jgi:membrane associated rhomboid family serine protease